MKTSIVKNDLRELNLKFDKYFIPSCMYKLMPYAQWDFNENKNIKCWTTIIMSPFILTCMQVGSSILSIELSSISSNCLPGRGERSLCRRYSGIGGGLAHCLIGKHAGGKLSLGLFEARRSLPVQWMNPFEQHDSQRSLSGEEHSVQHHDPAHCFVGPKSSQTHDPTTVAPARDANSHNNIKHQLGEEDKKEYEEVERTVTPKCFVHRSVPTDEGAGGEEDYPEDGKTKAHSITGIHKEHSHTGDEIK